MSYVALSVPSKAIATASARGTLYWLLSLAFKYPTAEVFSAYQHGAFLDDLRDGLSETPHLQRLGDALDELEADLSTYVGEASLKDLRVVYTQTFDVGAPQPPCPPYEGHYRPGIERTLVLLELSQLYKHFGLAMSREAGQGELPDHLSAELQFMHFLTFKEIQALEEDTAELLHGYRLAQRDLLDRHLREWLPAFSQKLQRAGLSRFYAGLAALVAELVERDLDWLSAELAGDPSGGLPASPPADTPVQSVCPSGRTCEALRRGPQRWCPPA